MCAINWPLKKKHIITFLKVKRNYLCGGGETPCPRDTEKKYLDIKKKNFSLQEKGVFINNIVAHCNWSKNENDRIPENNLKAGII